MEYRYFLKLQTLGYIRDAIYPIKGIIQARVYPAFASPHVGPHLGMVSETELDAMHRILQREKQTELRR
jgi:arginine/lysine/ornithine decarboxylase